MTKYVTLKSKFIHATFIVAFAFSNNAYSHSGGTNSDGCHNDNINGGYHCHNSNSSDSGGEGEILIGALVVGLVYWAIVSNKPDMANISKHEANKISRFKLSLIPKSYMVNEGALLSLSYAF